MQAVMKTLDRNMKINFGAEMKRKHFILLHCGSLFFVMVNLKNKKMKTRNLFILFMLLVALSNCTKDNDKNTTSIKAEMNKDNLKISEVNLKTNSNGISQVEIVEGENHVDIIGNGEELWFYFNANAGDIYKISWQDSWWEEYTAGSIYVTGYEEDKNTLYFQEERLIQMNGSPKVISVENNGVVYLKVRGYDNEISGSFVINVEQLNTSTATLLHCDSTLNFSVSAGETMLYKIDLVKDSKYNLSIEGSEFIGAYGDEVAVKVSAYRAGLNQYYFLDEFAQSPVYNNGQSNIQDIIALETETVYLAIMGAYWWNPRSVSLSLVCQ
jgi:hypothetical protein